MFLLRTTSFALSCLPLVMALSFGSGCFAHSPATSEQVAELPDLDDGLIDSKMVFLMPPERWEALKRAECESDPGGGGCQSLFVRTADRHGCAGESAWTMHRDWWSTPARKGTH